MSLEKLGLYLLLILALCCRLLTADCSTEIAKFYALRDVAHDNGKIRFTPENIRYLRHQRENARRSIHMMHNRYYEMDYAVRRMEEAMMLRTHALLWGGPGGAKTGIVRDMLYVPRSFPDGSRHTDVFALQLNQLMSDAQIRGYLDPRKFQELKALIKEKIAEQYRITAEHINNDGTAVHFLFALLDEIDKANPLICAAILDILNEKIAQYGPVSVAVRTESVFSTSNMRIEEFIQSFREQTYESTARAFLDRFPYKIFLHNYITDPQLRKLAIERYSLDSAHRAREKLSSNALRFSDSRAQIKEFNSDLPEVDWIWLGNLAIGSSKFSKDAIYVTEEILHQMRHRMFTLRRQSEAAVLDAGGVSPDGMPIYEPPTIFSTRNIMRFSMDEIAVAVFLDLVALDESVLPTETLVRLCEEGIPIDRLSTWRLQDVILTGAPGDPILIPATGSGGSVSLSYGPQIQELLKDTFGIREETILKYILSERQDFVSVYEERMRSNQQKLEQVSEVLSQLLGRDALSGRGGIEEFINLVAPRMQPPAPSTN